MSIQTIINGMGRIDSSLNTYGLKDDDIQHMLNIFLKQEGVLDSGNDDFKVTASSPASMDVKIAKGQAVVEYDSYIYASHETKFWYVKSSAEETVTISPNTSGNDRIDIIVLKRNTTTSPDDEASNIFTIEAVEGTPATTPVPAPTPSDALKLAEVYVSNGTASITTSDITDSRQSLKFDWHQLDVKTYLEDGWIPIDFDRHTFSLHAGISLTNYYNKYKMTVDDETMFRVGDKIKLYDTNDSTVKYFIVTSVTSGYIEMISMFDGPSSSSLYSISSSSYFSYVLLSHGMPVDFPLTTGIEAGHNIITLDVDTSHGHSSASAWESLYLQGGNDTTYNPFRLFNSSSSQEKIYIPVDSTVRVYGILRWTDGNTASTFGLKTLINGTSSGAGDFSQRDGGNRAVNKLLDDIYVSAGDYIQFQTFNDLGSASTYANGRFWVDIKTTYSSSGSYNQG